MWGVPVLPLIIVVGSVILIALWSRMLLIGVLLIPIILVMRMIASKDDQQFRLLGLKFIFRGINKPFLNRLFHCNKNKDFWKSSAYSPIQFKVRNR